jgi:hypothetical protein
LRFANGISHESYEVASGEQWKKLIVVNDTRIFKIRNTWLCIVWHSTSFVFERMNIAAVTIPVGFDVS